MFQTYGDKWPVLSSLTHRSDSLPPLAIPQQSKRDR
jgi:hypothetical protein